MNRNLLSNYFRPTQPTSSIVPHHWCYSCDRQPPLPRRSLHGFFAANPGIAVEDS